MSDAPPPGTVERWAWAYVLARDLATKLAPGSPPSEWEKDAPERRIEAPGRPPELVVTTRVEKTPKPGALVEPKRRIQILHTFLHHELQAAELMAWALLAFPSAPDAFRRGLVAIFDDEIRHLGLYAAHVRKLGGNVGDHPVRDWFWQRVPLARTPAAFVAIMGLGLEGANLDHAPRFAEAFEAAGDAEGAAIQRTVAREEERHVAFAIHWFARLTGGLDFATWSAALPPPMTPVVFRGPSMRRDSRLRAGFPSDVLDELERCTLSRGR